jgi:hypothetical protein
VQEEAEPDAPPNPAFEALLAASCDPALSVREVARVVGRALAITASEELASPGLDPRGRIALLGHLVRYAAAFPDEVHPPAAARHERQEPERDIEEMRETLLRRMMEIGGSAAPAPGPAGGRSGLAEA